MGDDPAQPAAPGKTTPAMAQYLAQKQQVGPDTILLFRMGDFYETFYDDARRLAAVLGITLTTRDRNSPQPVPLAGIPYHALESYLARLVRAGVRVAISEQLEDPRLAKGVIKRDIVRIVTAGTLTEDALLAGQNRRYLLAIAPPRRPRADSLFGLAWMDLSTAEFLACNCTAAELRDQIARIGPAEILLADQADGPFLLDLPADVPVARVADFEFAQETALRALQQQFNVASLAGFGFNADEPALGAAGAVLRYVQQTQRQSLNHLTGLLRWHPQGQLLLDATTLRALEIDRPARADAGDGSTSLLATIDRTVTSPGARLLAAWLRAPLASIEPIRARHDSVDALLQNPVELHDIRELLRSAADLRRILARVALRRSTPRELAAIARTLDLLAALAGRLSTILAIAPLGLADALAQDPPPAVSQLARLLRESLVDEPATSSRDADVFRRGVHPELDRLRSLREDAGAWLARYQADLIQRTGLSGLKIGFNQVFGYYIELKRRDADRAPADFIRKQTLKDAERYITEPLQAHQDEVLNADQRIADLQQQLFDELCRSTLAHAGDLQTIANRLAELDCLASLAQLARERSYCRPELTEEPVLELEQARHPVLDQRLAERCVANDLALRCASRPEHLLLLTGPNMAGKSTFIRQAALLVILAQAGSFVPARRALIGLTDRVLARVGAGDDIARGASTFMIEMSETAYILRHATRSSLVVLDEIGRGTSTYDGLSLAWAIAEQLAAATGARTLFATHYHELTELARQTGGIANAHVAVREWNGQIVFVHQVVPGPVDRSYGLHVARLAGVPQKVLERAQAILKLLERTGGRQAIRRPLRRAAAADSSAPGQLELLLSPEQRIAEELRGLDLDQISPREALERIAAWQKRLFADD